MSRKTTTDTAQISTIEATAAQITPTVVLVCGTIGGANARALKEQVFHRLDLQIPSDFVGWAQIPETFQKDTTALKQTVAAAVRPFLTVRYIKDLWERSFAEDDIRRQFLPEIPGGAKPFKPQVIVLHWNIGNNASVATSFLKDLETALREAFLGRANPTITLVSVGNSSPELPKDTLYWPRFRLQTITEGGFEADTAWLYENCVNLILALITSELQIDIQERFGLKPKAIRWLWVGTSAVAVDVHTMRELVRQSVTRELLAPVLLQNELDASIEHDVVTKIEQLQKQLFDSGLDVLTQQGWTFETIPQKRTITSAALNLDSNLRSTLFKPVNDLNGVVSAGFQTGSLSNYYKDLRDTLKKALAAETNKAFAELCRYIRSILMITKESSPQDTSPPTNFLANPLQDLPKKITQDEFVTPEQEPRGLKAAVEAARQASYQLYRSADLEKRDLYRCRIGTDDYLETVGELDEEALGIADLRYKRFRRSSLSPLGFVLKLLPAWPLLTTLLIMLLEWDEWLAALIAGVFLSALGIFEHLSLEDVAKKLRQTLVRNLEQKIAQSILGVLAKALRDYRIQTVARLREISHALSDLYVALDQEHTNSSEQAARWEKHLGELDKRRETVHWLSDLEQCQTWINAAVNNSRIRGLGLRELIDSEILAKKHPASYRNILNSLTRRVENLVRETFEDSKLLPFDLPSRSISVEQDTTQHDTEQPRYPLLKQAKVWEWLYQIAQPLGGMGGTQLNIVGVEHPAAIQGALGEGSQYFKRRAPIPTRSRQKHEIICIRISAESA